jgi:hypothetical protein
MGIDERFSGNRLMPVYLLMQRFASILKEPGCAPKTVHRALNSVYLGSPESRIRTPEGVDFRSHHCRAPTEHGSPHTVKI